MAEEAKGGSGSVAGGCGIGSRGMLVVVVEGWWYGNRCCGGIVDEAKVGGGSGSGIGSRGMVVVIVKGSGSVMVKW